MYTLYHKIFKLSIVFYKILDFFRELSAVDYVSAVCSVLLSLSYIFIIAEVFYLSRSFFISFDSQIIIINSTKHKINFIIVTIVVKVIFFLPFL